MGIAHFQCWGLEFSGLSSLGMDFFLNVTGNGKIFLKLIGIRISGYFVNGNGIC